MASAIVSSPTRHSLSSQRHRASASAAESVTIEEPETSTRELERHTLCSMLDDRVVKLKNELRDKSLSRRKKTTDSPANQSIARMLDSSLEDLCSEKGSLTRSGLMLQPLSSDDDF